MRLTINLATRPFADLGPALQRLRIGMGALALAAILLGLGLHALEHKAEAVRARERAVDSAIAKVNSERQSYENMVRQPDNAQALGQVSALNKLIDVKAFSWTLAMEDLETVLPGGVQVTTLEPTVDKKDGHITVRMRVVGPRDKAVSLVANLEHSRHFLQPRIVGEASESNTNGNQQLEPVSASNRVNFDLLADYNPVTPTDRRSASAKAQADGKQVEQDLAGKAPSTAASDAHPAAPHAARPGLPRPLNVNPARPAGPNPRSGGPR